MSSTKNQKILLIGPLPNLKANKIGGARISFSYLLQYFEKEDLPYILINTKPFERDFRRFLNPIIVLAKFLLAILKVDIVFVNVSQGGTKTLAPLFYILTKLFGKKFVFRPFGGSLKDHYENYNSFQKWLFHNTILQSDIFYLQTKELIKYFSEMGGNILQLPTSRNNSLAQDSRHFESACYLKNYQKRFIFMGHVKESKGIDLILEAAKKLGKDYTFHIYGPIKEAKYRPLFENDHSNYKGVLKKEEVLKTLQKYDVLILPTWFPGEGYPGAIIEAYSLGLPIITTQWKAIPEIVEHQKTGLLIEPKSSESFENAVQHFDDSNYKNYSKNARNYFLKNFDAEKVNAQIIKELKTLDERFAGR